MLKNKFGLMILSASTVDNILKLEGNFPIVDGVTVKLKDVSLEPGGEYNLAILYNRIGGKILMSGPVGTDIYGKFIIDTDKELGIDTSYLKVVDGYKVPLANTIVAENGAHTFASYMPGIAFDFDPDIFDKLELASAYFLSGYNLTKGDYFSKTALKLMYKAKEIGIPVFFDPGPMMKNASEEMKQEIYKNVDVISLNEIEIEDLTGVSDPVKGSEIIMENSNALILAKQGSKGCYVVSREMEGKWYPTFKVDLVDTSGCGDSFLAAFSYGYLEGFDIDTCVILANCAGAVKASKFGTGRNVPTFEEMVNMLESNGYTVNQASKDAGAFIDLKLGK